MRIEELSRRSAVSVRNIREYQDRGLLPPPDREGRVALYDDDHVIRLRLVARLLTRGYALAVIRDLIEAWAGGRDLHDVLGLEAVVSRPWGRTEPVRLTRRQVQEAFGGRLSGTGLRLLVDAGVFVPAGDGFECRDLRLFDSMPILTAEGIPADASAAVVARLREHLDAVAGELVELVVSALLPEGTPRGATWPGWPGLSSGCARSRTWSQTACSAWPCRSPSTAPSI
jgi:DNA-binding transcriptional MerR regulator